MIPIAKPLIGNEEKKEVQKVLNSGMIAQGQWVTDFESEFAKFIGSKYAIATSSGTAALHLSILALDIKNGDEVITTPFTFIASANSILYTGAKPIFSDINPTDFNINPDLIESKITKRTKAILPVHLYGLPAELSKIQRIAKKHKLKIIEDACQAHGSKYKNKKVGAIGNLGCFSFYPTKNMTTGEGGMITTNSKNLCEKILILRNQGMKTRYYHNEIGFNYRMTNIQAAIGIHQLRKLNKFNQIRISNALYLNKQLENIKGIITPTIPSNRTHVFHQYTIRITPQYPISRQRLINVLNLNGIGNSIYYPLLISHQRPYQKLGFKTKYPVAEKATTQVLSLPVHPQVTKKDLNQIAKLLRRPTA
jgi:perosamine synthetase